MVMDEIACHCSASGISCVLSDLPSLLLLSYLIAGFSNASIVDTCVFVHLAIKHCAGDPMFWSLGVFPRSSNAKYGFSPASLHLFSVILTVCTAFSPNLFDWGYRKDDVVC